MATREQLEALKGLEPAAYRLLYAQLALEEAQDLFNPAGLLFTHPEDRQAIHKACCEADRHLKVLKAMLRDLKAKQNQPGVQV